jgi:hypothetical protein
MEEELRWPRHQCFLRSSRDSAPVIKIDFVDFWPGFDKTSNYLTDLLLRRYSLEISRAPDFLVYSCFGERHLKYRCPKIFYTGENVRPDFEQCDFAFTFDHIQDNSRHFRLPLYAWWENAERLVKPTETDYLGLVASKTKFCNFVYGNGESKRRLDFLEKLSDYKPVDCAGTLRNNIGRTIGVFEKVNFIRDYKFTISFENASYPGYTTEKIVHPMLADSIAIYWGNPLVHLDFNPASFVNVHDYGSDEAAIERVIELDKDDRLYAQCLAEPFYRGNIVNRYVDPEKILDQFDRIFGTARSGA